MSQELPFQELDMLKCKKNFYNHVDVLLLSVYNRDRKKEEAKDMKFDELFEQRNLVASKLKDCIRDKGYTKVSFASKADISRPTLDKLLSGSIDNKSSFDRHMQKILRMLNMTAEDLLLYHSAPAKVVSAAIFSQNAPVDYEISDTAKKQYDLLLDVVDLCAIYY